MTINRRELERKEGWREWAKEIPMIKFPSHWYVKILPPFAESIVRFWIYTKLHNHPVSVYLDPEDQEWEVHPCVESPDNTFRCDMNDIKALLGAIEKALKYNI